MGLNKNAMFVDAAIQRRKSTLMAKSSTLVMESFSLPQFESIEKSATHNRSKQVREPYARSLSVVNEHITAKQELIDEASAAYEDIANLLASKLGWEQNAIKIFPQGSASTKTLIRALRNGKFDIDAVCEVDISKIEAQDPIAFFDTIGIALDGLDAEPKRRCWTINFANKRFYLEFTPSVPLSTVPLTERQLRGLKHAEPEFLATALAVVDRPSQNWKTSNPAGIRDWVNRASGRHIIFKYVTESRDSVSASIEPVAKQSVEIEEALRIAIRLFKRHRDICVYRGHLDAETQPISIILVTLLTTCYEGLADLIQEGQHPPFTHIVDALIALAELLPEMIPHYEDLGYYLPNPTVVDENFAERWNSDEGDRAKSFQIWCGLLQADLAAIAILRDPDRIMEKTLEVFGCTAAGDSAGGNGNSIPRVIPPSPKPAPRTTGLA